jgi:hypothetical protein
MALDWLPQEDRDRTIMLKPHYLNDAQKFLQMHEPGEGKLNYLFCLDGCASAAVLIWLVDEDLAQTRKYFQLAGQAGLKMMEERWATWQQTCPAEEASRTLECAIISGDTELMKKVAAFLCEPTEYRTGHPTVCWYAALLKNMALGEEVLARKNIEGLSLSTKKLPLQMMGKLFAAVLDNDEKRILEELRTHVKWHRGRLKPKHISWWSYDELREHNWIDFEFYMSIPGLAFCSFAAGHGIQIDIDEPFLPKKLFSLGR